MRYRLGALAALIYIYVLGYLGFFVSDDYLVLTFPSWPFLIMCGMDCGRKMLIALVSNGILVGGVIVVIARVLVGPYKKGA